MVAASYGLQMAVHFSGHSVQALWLCLEAEMHLTYSARWCMLFRHGNSS